MVPESELPEQLSGVGAIALGVARLRVTENARPDLRELAANYHRSVPAELAGATTEASHAGLATATPQGLPTP